jgi:hypothetical protein
MQLVSQTAQFNTELQNFVEQLTSDRATEDKLPLPTQIVMFADGELKVLD